MAYKQDKRGEVVISGWEDGIADSPFEGIADMRNVDIDSVPGEVAVAFDVNALTKPPTVSAVAFTVEAATDLITVSSTSGYYNGMAITLDSLTDGAGLATGRVYWIGDLSGNTFKVYQNPSRNAGKLVNVTSDGSGTLSSYTLGQPLDRVTSEQANTADFPYTFILDSNGRVWWIDVANDTITNNLIYLGNDTLTSSGDRAIIIWKNYLVVSRSSAFDAVAVNRIEQDIDFDSSSGWTYGFESVSSQGINSRRIMFVGQDDVLYYDNSNRVGSLTEAVGSTFDPTSGATWVENTGALDIPSGEVITALSEIGVYLLVGTVRNRIFPWDRVSPSFNFPIILPESNVARIVGTNQLAFIFVGARGNIYVTDGTNLELFKKIPDHLTGKREPYYTWLDANYHRNNLVFSFTAQENDGTSITSMNGVWAINIATSALRHVITPSNGSSAEVHTIITNPHNLVPAGAGLIVGWKNSTTYGVDIGSSNPYDGGETVIDTDIIPIGNNLDKTTLADIEFKLTRALVSGESIALGYRTKLEDSYTNIFTANTAGELSARSDATFENAEWVQFEIILTSTTTSPSRVPLKEIRMRLGSE